MKDYVRDKHKPVKILYIKNKHCPPKGLQILHYRGSRPIVPEVPTY